MITTFLEALWQVLLELAPWLLLGAAVAGALHVLLPKDFVRRRLRGRAGVLQAVLLGIPLPLCSCGVIPAGLGLKQDGASNGAAIGFLVSTPQTGVDSILVSASFLGWPFALFKVASAFVLGLIAGTWVEAVEPGSASASEPPSSPGASDRRPSWREGLDHAVDMIRLIWGWLVFGVVASALITTLVPAQAFASVSAYGGVLAMAAMLAVSLPLYVCATASVPIAAALVAGGFPPGAALVFLMAGPATNVATIGAVRRAFGTRTLAIYLVTIAAGSVGLGWLFDVAWLGAAGFGGQGALAATHAAHHGASPLAIASAGLLIAMLAWFAIEDLRQLVARRRTAGPRPFVEVPVQGLTCNGCVRKLKRKLQELPEVGAIAVSREAGTCRVENALADRVRAAIREAGFESP